MISQLETCDSVVFDCDGVILQSNRLKSDAFGAVLEGYDPALVKEFVDWHKRTGGVSRFEKFRVFFKDMLKDDAWPEKTDKACADFGDHVSKQLLVCPFVPGFEELLGRLTVSGIPLSVNTGGSETEITAVFRSRGLSDSFRAVYGSPTPKRDNMIKLQADKLIGPRCLYFGDSRLDFDLAEEFCSDFVYIAHESEWTDGAEVTQAAGGLVAPDHRALLSDR